MVWSKLKVSGKIPPQLNGPTLQYSSGSIYLLGGEVSSATDPSIRFFDDCYILDLSTLTWSMLTPATKYTSRYFTGSALIDNHLYMLYGWSNLLNADVSDIYFLDLAKPTNWYPLDTYGACTPMDSYGFSQVNSTVYLFGGYQDSSNINTLQVFANSSCTVLSESYLSPEARMYHSMAVINGDLYVYGGVGVSGTLDDMWSYSEAGGWTSLKVTGDSPGARSSQGCGAEGNVMIIWGGINESGYLNDMYMYELLSDTWQLISPSGTSPSPRAGSCLVVLLPYVFIFGGITTAGLSGELWQYSTATNEYTLLFTESTQQVNAPSPCKYPICDFINNKFVVMFGTGDSETPFESVYSYDFTINTWDVLFNAPFSLMSRSLAMISYINGYILVMAGEAWATDPYTDAFIIDLSTGISTYLVSLPFYYYGGAFSLVKNKIYLLGGGSMIGNTMRVSIPTPNFILISLTDLYSDALEICSTGSYGTGADCTLCPAGSYAESPGLSACISCAAGTYNNMAGANSARQCYPCVQGTFSSQIGANYCFDCPDYEFCPVGSTSFTQAPILMGTASSQPANYIVSSGISSEQIVVFAAIPSCFLIFLLVFTLVPKVQHITVKLDLFKTDHNYTLNEALVMDKTILGGLFSIMFMLVALIMISSSILDYENNNIEETKALMPVVILEQLGTQIIAEITVQLTLFSYGGLCTDQCLPGGLFNITLSKVLYWSYQTTCKLVNGNCVIYISCNNCNLQTGAVINYDLQEKSSFCSAIGVSINSTSSIPQQYSSISDMVAASSNKVFRGFNPTDFNLMMTPSLFITDTTNWNSPQTGYHISIDTNPVPGSQLDIYE